MKKFLRIECSDHTRAAELSRRLTCPKCVLYRNVEADRYGNGFILTVAHEQWCKVPQTV